MKKFASIIIAMALLIASCAFAYADAAPGVMSIENGAQFDLDGDGTTETIAYEYSENEYGDGEMTISVNGAELKFNMMCGTGELHALTLADGRSYLLAGEYGYSDDMGSHVVRYGEGALTRIGGIGALPDSMTVNGNVITAPVRGSKLHTWFREGDFVIAESMFFGEDYQPLPTEYYVAEAPRASYVTDVVVRLKQDVELKDSLLGTETFTLTKGSTAVITATDDSSYIYLAVTDPEAADWHFGGYMLLGSGACDVIVDGESVFSADVFDGLLFAD